MTNEQYLRASQIRQEIRDLEGLIEDINASIKENSRGLEMNARGGCYPVARHIYPLVEQAAHEKINELTGEYERL
jgi:hypothetical protein